MVLKNNEIYILDYPTRLTTKKVTEEGKKNLEKSMKMYTKLMNELRKTHNIKMVLGDKIYDF